MTQKEKIVIIGLTGIGNMFMFIPTLILLRKKFINSEFVLMSFNRSVGDFFLTNRFVDKVIYLSDPYSKKSKLLSFLCRIINLLYLMFLGYRYTFQLSIFPFSHTSNFLASLSYSLRAKKKIIHSSSRLFNLFKNRFILLPTTSGLHDVEQNLLIFYFLFGVHQKLEKVELPKLYRTFILSNQEIVIVPSEKSNNSEKVIITAHLFGKSSCSLSRNWSIEKFEELFYLIQKKTKLQIDFLLLGSREDEDKINKLLDSKSIKCHKVINSGFIKLLNIIDNSAAFIGIDSSISHLAAFTETTIFSIIGPTDAQETTPFSNNVNILKASVPCSPCFNSKYSDYCPHQNCLKQLDTELLSNSIVNKLGLSNTK